MTLPIPVLTVSQLNRQVRSWLENEVGVICVEGEVSNLSKPSSGHYYFTLKDAASQLRCVYFRNHHFNSNVRSFQNGQQIIAQGKLSLYEARGDYQLIVEQVSEAGQGDLFQQFERLKVKLMALGLFDPQRKKPLPPFPQVIGVVTSENAAALRDILITLARRFPLAEVLVYASDVQGKLAPQQLINAIVRANYDQRCDVIILARGGGSIEDLWAFNDERLAHAIADSQIPIVSGVGHETDFTIADFVADLRAPTPTAAAEAVTPDLLALIGFLQTTQSRLITIISRFMRHKNLLLNHQLEKMASPKRLIMSHWQTLDFLKSHLSRATGNIFAIKQHQLRLALTRLEAKNPNSLLLQARAHLSNLERHLFQLIQTRITHHQQAFTTHLATLHAVSPLATLERGYAIVSCRHKILFNSEQVSSDDIIDIRLAKGTIKAHVV